MASTPEFIATPIVGWVSSAVTAANTAKDGTGTVNEVITYSAKFFVEKLIFRAAGTNVATVARIFINNGSTNTTAANNVLYTEVGLAATTLSETSPQTHIEVPLGISLPANYKINVVLATAVSAGYYISGVGGYY